MFWKKLIFLFSFLFLFFLYGCGKSNKTEENIKIKIGTVNILLKNDFILSSISNNIVKNVDWIYAYRQKKGKNGFYNSIIIGEYKGNYPKDKKKFFSIVVDKLKREIVGLKIQNVDNFSKDKVYVYYVKYKVDDNLFGNDKLNVYYSLQAYIFNENEKKIYLISAVGLEQEFINNILDSIKNLQING